MAFTKEIKQKLIKACESGEYKWCEGKFEETKNGVTYNCAVGVLAKVMGVPLFKGKYNNYKGIREVVGEGRCVPSNFIENLYRVNDGDMRSDQKDIYGTYPINFIKSLQTCD